MAIGRGYPRFSAACRRATPASVLFRRLGDFSALCGKPEPATAEPGSGEGDSAVMEMKMVLENTPACEVCGEPATRVCDGHDMCSLHREGDLVPEVPVPRCAVDGCECAGTVVIGATTVCIHHVPHARRVAA
jgi:hypothetical protein